MNTFDPKFIINRSRTAGIRTHQIMTAVAKIERGEKLLYVAPKFVIMPMAEWERLKELEGSPDLQQGEESDVKV